jgi:hypothetical protein
MDDEECFETATLGLLSELTGMREEATACIQRVVRGKRPNLESDRFPQAGRPRKRADGEPAKHVVWLPNNVFRPFQNGIAHTLIAVGGNDPCRLHDPLRKQGKFHGITYSNGLAQRLLNDTLGLLDARGRQLPLASRHLLTKLHQLLAKPILGDRNRSRASRRNLRSCLIRPASLPVWRPTISTPDVLPPGSLSAPRSTALRPSSALGYLPDCTRDSG